MNKFTHAIHAPLTDSLSFPININIDIIKFRTNTKYEKIERGEMNIEEQITKTNRILLSRIIVEYLFHLCLS